MSIHIVGLEEAIHRFGRMEVQNALTPPMQRAVMRVHGRMADYPPAPPNSRYIRGFGMMGSRRRTSERLGQSWTTTVTRTAARLLGRVGTNVSYAPWVQSQRFQTAAHRRTGWPTDQGVLDGERAWIEQQFSQAIERILGR
jgi:hypothetical protein